MIAAPDSGYNYNKFNHFGNDINISAIDVPRDEETGFETSRFNTLYQEEGPKE